MGKLHFLNVGCADASVIVIDGATFLVDCHDIESYDHLLPRSKKLRGVFITHQHEDHYSGLGFLKDQGFTIDCLVYSPYTRRRGDSSVSPDEWNEFNGYRDYFEAAGTKTYAPFRQADFKKAWWSTNGLKVFVLGPDKAIAQSPTRALHDASLVFLVELGSRRCVFTGDASDTNLQHVADNTTGYCNDILHASHHGSINGANSDFIDGCQAKVTIVSTKSGVHSNVPHPTAMARYRRKTKDKVYRTDVDGTRVISF